MKKTEPNSIARDSFTAATTDMFSRLRLADASIVAGVLSIVLSWNVVVAAAFGSAAVLFGLIAMAKSDDEGTSLRALLGAIGGGVGMVLCTAIAILPLLGTR